jgi:hypothetical protein
MPKFAIVDLEVGEEQYTTLEAAVDAAKNTVKDEPDSTIDVVQIMKNVTSRLEVVVEDVE